MTSNLKRLKPTTEMHERDIAATDEMIRNLKAGTSARWRPASALRRPAAGGASLLVWTCKQGNDPEALKEALRNMPPLNVMVKLDPDSKVTLADGGTVTLANPPVFPQAAMSGGNSGSHDPAISTNVKVFKTIAHGTEEVITGWKFANGASTKPMHQYCYLKKATSARRVIEDIGDDGVMGPTPPGVLDQRAITDTSAPNDVARCGSTGGRGLALGRGAGGGWRASRSISRLTKSARSLSAAR